MRPKIYVACLSAYNAGKLHGAWIDATQDVDDIHAEIRKMLKKSPERDAEEYAIHDYKGFFDINLSEYASIKTVSALAKAIEEYGESFALYYSALGFSTIDDAISNFLDSFIGEFDSKTEWAESHLADSGGLDEIPEWVKMYFDFKAYVRDMELSGDILFLKKYVYWNR